jgi:hypothetical protein
MRERCASAVRQETLAVRGRQDRASGRAGLWMVVVFFQRGRVMNELLLALIMTLLILVGVNSK